MKGRKYDFDGEAYKAKGGALRLGGVEIGILLWFL
jgi:hypothetical protein